MKKILFAILLVAAPVLAQYEVSVTSIPVWVKVVDKNGNPIIGLKEEDFEIYEDGKRVPTSCFEEVTLEVGGAAPVQPSGTSTPITKQKYVVFLDLYNTTPREYASVKPALQSFLDNFTNNSAELML